MAVPLQSNVEAPVPRKKSSIRRTIAAPAAFDSSDVDTDIPLPIRLNDAVKFIFRKHLARTGTWMTCEQDPEDSSCEQDEENDSSAAKERLGEVVARHEANKAHNEKSQQASTHGLSQAEIAARERLDVLMQRHKSNKQTLDEARTIVREQGPIAAVEQADNSRILSLQEAEAKVALKQQLKDSLGNLKTVVSGLQRNRESTADPSGSRAASDANAFAKMVQLVAENEAGNKGPITPQQLEDLARRLGTSDNSSTIMTLPADWEQQIQMEWALQFQKFTPQYAVQNEGKRNPLLALENEKIRGLEIKLAKARFRRDWLKLRGV